MTHSKPLKDNRQINLESGKPYIYQIIESLQKSLVTSLKEQRDKSQHIPSLDFCFPASWCL